MNCNVFQSTLNVKIMTPRSDKGEVSANKREDGDSSVLVYQP